VTPEQREEWIQIAHDALDICTYVAEELYSGGEHEVLWEIMCLHMNAGLPMPSWVTETIAESKDDSWEKLFGPVPKPIPSYVAMVHGAVRYVETKYGKKSFPGAAELLTKLNVRTSRGNKMTEDAARAIYYNNHPEYRRAHDRAAALARMIGANVADPDVWDLLNLIADTITFIDRVPDVREALKSEPATGAVANFLALFDVG
jgi:hypothetical protein